MRLLRKTAALLLMLLLVASMAACSSNTPTEPSASADLEYRVSVVDVQGNPYTDGVIVRFMSGTEQVAMQVVDASGVAAKTLATGEYTVELKFTGDENAYYYDSENLKLTAQAPELQITLTYAPTAEPVQLFAQGENVKAYPVTTGGTRVQLEPGKRNYFLFTPEVAGLYEFTTVEKLEGIGYYGAPHFVQEFSAAEVKDGAFTVSIKASMIGTGGAGTTTLVLGIDSVSEESCTLTVTRIGEPERTLEDEPWSVYQPTAKLSAYQLPQGASLREFDLTAATDAYTLVLGTDGFYHLNTADGPLVLVNLGTDGKYLDCFKTILDHTGVNRYFFDDKGEFVKKESYSECLLEYFKYMDEDAGVYPLTEDLKYIIQMEGADSGWFDPDNALYLFRDDNGIALDGINNEICWLFMCSYIA